MKFWYCENQKWAILGITIAQIKTKKSGAYLYICGLPVYRVKSMSIVAQFVQNDNFDTRKYDETIANIVDDIPVKSFIPQSEKVAFLATTLYDSGGHTKCIRDLAKSFKGIYTEKLFLTKKSKSLEIMTELRSFMDVQDLNMGFRIKKTIQKIVNDVIAFAPKTVLAYIHSEDIIGAGVLAVLKKAGIKIIFVNHASHYPNLGMNFADLILEGMPTTEKLTHEKRGYRNTQIVGLQSLSKNETVYYSADELKALKEQMGIPVDNIITMSGGTGYKFFEKDSSPYFEMIKRLLQKESNVTHIVISELLPQQQAILDAIFKDEQLKKRLIILPFQKDFDKYFQIADVFVDSFPVSSALTQIDLMRNKVASVVKINREIPHFSFHEYQMPDYPYMFENVDDMEKAISELLHDTQKRADIIKRNYDFWMKTYESDIFRDKIIRIIEEKSNV